MSATTLSTEVRQNILRALKEQLRLQENTLLGFSQTSGRISYWIPSPWYLTNIIFAFLTFLLYKIVVRRVRRIPA